MKMGLKTRLIISYTTLSLLLVFALLLISNILLERQFNSYIQEKQEQKNFDFVQSVLAEFEANKRPSTDYLLSLGEKALDEGIILMVNDKLGNEIFCMSCFDGMRCEDMLNAMENTMKQRYPNFSGQYTERVYPLEDQEINYGSVKLGFYGPFYYNDADIKFMGVLNTLFIEVAFVFLIIAFLLGFFMASRISKPIKAVTLKTKEIESGNYTDRIDFTSKTTEIDHLIENVNRLAATLEGQQSLKKRMAMDYAHEFRTPLAAIQSNLEGIIDGIFEPTNERIESIRGEILRLSRMVSDIDKIAELQNDNLILQKEYFDFCELLKQILTTFEAEIQDKSITLTIKAESCHIYADQDKISSIIINLISNAVKFTEKKGEIGIVVKDKKDSILFSVTDNGVGIDKNDLPYIFEHLYRTDHSRTRGTGGSGIGLSVVKAVLNSHNGTIEVKSSMGAGTAFQVTLPKK